jgi:HEAT repeat protein
MDDRVSCLKALLTNSQTLVAFRAAIALGNVGPRARDAIPALINGLQHKFYGGSWEIRKACAGALASVAQPDEGKSAKSEVLEGLRRALDDSCHQVRFEAAQSLVTLGTPANAQEKDRIVRTLKALADGRTEKHKIVRIWAHVGVMRMDKIEEKRLAIIGDMLKDPLLGVRCQAARALGTMGPVARSQREKLTLALYDKDVILVGWAVWALGCMGKDAKDSVDDLKKIAKEAKKDGNEGLKLTINAAIKAITEPPPNKNPDKKGKG